MDPAYDFSVFIVACSKGTKYAILSKGAMNDAETHFNFFTQNAVLEFIAGDGLENLKFHNTRPKDKWRQGPPIPMVDAYKFSSGESRRGYIAFFQAPTTMWIIKSFHPDPHEGDLNISPFAVLKKLKSATDLESEG